MFSDDDDDDDSAALFLEMWFQLIFKLQLLQIKTPTDS